MYKNVRSTNDSQKNSYIICGYILVFLYVVALNAIFFAIKKVNTMVKTVKKKAAPKKKAKNTQLQTVSSSEIVSRDNSAQQLSPIQQMQQLKAMGFDVNDMKDMLMLQREYEKDQSIKEFNLALAAFKSEDIQIFKNKKVSYETDKGKTEYDHASLDNIVAITTPFLSKHSFSHRWHVDQSSDKGMVKITFILTHKSGHSENTSLQAGLDQSGGKNNIQALASTVSYLERYTFLAGTGLAVKDMDDDGAAAGELVDVISESQLADMISLIDEVGSTEIDFANHCRLDSLSDMPLTKYASAIQALKAKGEQS